MRDIGTWPGPNYHDVEQRVLDRKLVAESESLQNEIDDTNRAIGTQKQRQMVLRDSTSNSEKTMNQLLELQKLTLQKGQTNSPEEIQAFANSQKLFLANQAKYQAANEQVADLNEQLTRLQARQREVSKKLDADRPLVHKEFQQLQTRHQLKLAAIKLSVLVPLLALAGWLFIKRRATLYAPLLYGFGLALAVKTLQVMHEHFPTRYFKYILVGIGLLLVWRILVYLLRMMAFPKVDLLLKQYREAYEHFLCPVCTFPIRRGPLKYLFWTRSSLKRLKVPANGTPADEPYVCPVCETRLFEPCGSCREIRHSLLPGCVHCGAQKPFPPPTSESTAPAAPGKAL
jgi:hypothetical protein